MANGWRAIGCHGSMSVPKAIFITPFIYGIPILAMVPGATVIGMVHWGTLIPVWAVVYWLLIKPFGCMPPLPILFCPLIHLLSANHPQPW